MKKGRKRELTTLCLSNGQASRCSDNTSKENKKTYETPKEQLTPDSRKENEINTQNIPADLAEIVTVWPELPDTIRLAIVAIIRTSKGL